MTIVYCTSCGVQNAQGARFCINCGAALDLKAPAPPGVTAPPYQPPYQPPYAQPRQSCEQRSPQEEQCMGQTRVPGLVVFAVIILMIGVFALLQWYLSLTYPTTNYAGVVWPLFGIVLALALIGVWLVARPRAR